MSRVFKLVCVCFCVQIVSVVCQFGFFPQREERRTPFGFAQNFLPDPRRFTESINGIFNFRPRNPNRYPQNSQNNYPNNIPGITDNRPIIDQYRPNNPYNQYNQYNQGSNNVKFPESGRDIPNDYVNFEQTSNPYEQARPNENNNYPVFNDNSNYNNNNQNEEVIVADNNGPETPSPVMVVEEAVNLPPSFDDRNGPLQPSEVPEASTAGYEFSTSTLPPLTPVPVSEVKNFGTEGIFSETCDTVDGEVGSCIPINGCEPYKRLLQQPGANSGATKQLLRRAHCGFQGNTPKVCCPRPGIPDAPPPSPPPVTPEPVIPTPSGKSVGDFVDHLPEPPVCGVSNASFTRVVGGVKGKLGDFPWMALLGYKRGDANTGWLCGGSLVSSRHVLTAAHCIHNHEKDLYLVRLGELDLARDDEGATPVDVLIKTKFKHENYDAKSFTNDIGILLLDKDVQFTDLIRPICIPKEPELRSRSWENYNPLIAGWGDTEFRGPSATHLQVLQLPVVSNEFCSQAYAQYKAQVIDQRVLCAGFKKGGRDACQGDSGGPLMQPIWNSETYETFFYQIGVVSFGRKCAEAGFPGVYTRVTQFVPWIQEKLLGTN